MADFGLTEATKRLFEDLFAEVPEVIGVLLVSADGLPIVHELKPGINAERISAMVATAVNLGKKVSPTVGIGEVGEVTINASEGNLFLYIVNQSVTLAILTPNEVNMGMIFFKSAGMVESLKELIKEQESA
ncbi:MAG: hypothetical protein CL946_01485 [Ectothiorhodospiraceae bacterium]|nr:hypothetical protein [Ectothiorhodospiraceae bacterium]